MIDAAQEARNMQMQARITEVFQHFKAQIEAMEKEGRLPKIDDHGLGPMLKMVGFDLTPSGILSMFEGKLSKAGEHPEQCQEIMVMLYDALGYCLGYTDQIGG